MAIEEKQRALEFTFVPDGIDGDLKYDITYDDSNPVFPIRIKTGGGSNIDYPLELFTEVVEFLTSKGVIKPNVLSRTIETPGGGNSMNSTMNSSALGHRSFDPPLTPSIPVPQVVRHDVGDNGVLTSNTDPLASFDITSQVDSSPLMSVDFMESKIPPTPELVRKMDSGSPPIPQILKNGSGDGLVQPTRLKPEDMAEAELPTVAKEISTRPVIRSRVIGDDPQSAEKEAALLRSSHGKGKGKTVRKAHRVEE